MDDAEERHAACCDRPQGSPQQPPVDQARGHPGPHQARDDEAGGEHVQRVDLDGQRTFDDRAGCGHLVGMDHHHRRQRRHAGNRHRRIVTHGRGMEALGRDLQADKHQDRQDRRSWDDLVKVGEAAGDAGPTDDHRGGQRVSRPAPHRLVGGVADVGRGLDHAAAGSGNHRGQAFDRDDPPGVILVASRRRALRAVDAAHNGAQRKGNHDRQILQRVAPGLKPLKLGGRQPLCRPEGGSRVDHRMPLTSRQPAGRRAHRIERPAHRQGRQGPGNPQRKRNRRGQARQHNPHRHQADDRRAHNLQRRQKGDQGQGDRRQAAEQTGPGHHPADARSKRRAGKLEEAARHDGAHTHMPGMPGSGLLLQPTAE